MQLDEMGLKSFIVTEEYLEKQELKYYGGGTLIKVGDKILFGFTNNYASTIGKQPDAISENDPVSLTMNSFVIKDGFVYQLYKRK
jgi:hypothetical protein